MLLQSHKSFDTVAEYDPVKGALTPFSRAAQPERASSERISGVFDYLGGKCVMMYRLAGILYLQIHDRRIPVEGHVIDLPFVKGDQVLRVLVDGRIIIELMYTPIHLEPPLSIDPTAFAEEEDFDFALFLANISRDRDRQARMYPEP